MIRIVILFYICLSSISAFGVQDEVDSAKTLGFEAISAYGCGTAFGLAGHFIIKTRSKDNWMSPGFAYLFPLGATIGVIATGETNGTPAKNIFPTAGITLASAYLPVLLGELIGLVDSRGLTVLFSPIAAIATYNYIKNYDARNSTNAEETQIFSFYYSF